MKQTTLWKKDFTLVVIGQIISLFGNGILRFALPLYLLQVTGSSAVFGLVSALSFLPLIILMPIGGILADRANKRNIMVLLDALTGIFMLAFLLLLGNIALTLLLVITLMLLYSISGLYQPTVQASVPILLDKTVLVKGNGIVSSISGLANLLSPIIGGLLFGTYGITPIVTLSIICFLLSAVLECFIKIPHQKSTQKGSVFQLVKEDTGQAIAFIFRKKPTLRKLIGIVLLLNAFISAMIIIALPVLITERLLLSEELYGFSQGVLALGALCGGVMTSVLGDKLKIEQLSRYLVYTAVTLLPLTCSMLFANNPIISYILILVTSFALMCVVTTISVLIITYIQSQTTTQMIGKVMAFLMTISMLATPFGQAIYGIAFEWSVGKEWIILLGVVLIVLLISGYTRRIFK